jgi:hypothetical protein
LWEAASKYDVDTLDKIFADDWIGFNAADGQRWTKARGIDIYRHNRYTEVKFLKDREVFRIDNHTAIMSYEVQWRAEGTAGGGKSWGHSRSIHCWVQRDGGWFLKHTETVDLPMPQVGPPAVDLQQFLQPPANALFPIGTTEPKAPPATTQPKEPPATEWKHGVRASGSWQTEIPERAFDGKRDTDWNSGDYAPGWIERDLGCCRTLSSIALFPCQDIPGMTVHEVWVSSDPIGKDRKGAKLVHVFEGNTENYTPLKFDFPKDLTARYVQVRTTKSPTWIAWWEIEIRVRERGQEKVIPLEGAKQH